jgi:hypothetical protein
VIGPSEFVRECCSNTRLSVARESASLAVPPLASSRPHVTTIIRIRKARAILFFKASASADENLAATDISRVLWLHFQGVNYQGLRGFKYFCMGDSKISHSF